MPQRIQDHVALPPRDRLRRDGGESLGYFYPGEVAKLLDLELINYRALRQCYKVVREQSGLPVRSGWARYTLADLAGLQAILSAYGGKDILRPERRLNLRPLASACASLRRRGYSNPLLQVPMRKEGARIYALVEGVVLEPATNQVLVDTALEAAAGFLLEAVFTEPALHDALEKERQEASRLRSAASMLVVPDRHLIAG